MSAARPLIVDLFAGPGGWSEGLRMLGLADVGIEWDDASCRTRAAAGHLTIRADVAQYPPEVFAGKVSGLIASPPCQDFSSAGAKRGRRGRRGRLIDVVPEWVDELRPEWVACEQVQNPEVEDAWERHALRYARLGFSTWVGTLDAANWGVPQNRRRYLLLASRAGWVAPPAPTHSPTLDLFGRLPWVSLSAALGLEGLGWVYDSGQNSAAAGGRKERYIRSCDRPAGTVTGQTTSQWVLKRGAERRKLTTADAARLQTFPEGYPFQGSRQQREQQIGDAVPPLLAAHIVAALTGQSMEAAA